MAESTIPNEDIPLSRIEMWVCRLCLDGAGGECHVPGCSFWIHDAPTGDLLDLLRTRITEMEAR